MSRPSRSQLPASFPTIIERRNVSAKRLLHRRNSLVGSTSGGPQRNNSCRISVHPFCGRPILSRAEPAILQTGSLTPPRKLRANTSGGEASVSSGPAKWDTWFVGSTHHKNAELAWKSPPLGLHNSPTSAASQVTGTSSVRLHQRWLLQDSTAETEGRTCHTHAARLPYICQPQWRSRWQ